MTCHLVSVDSEEMARTADGRFGLTGTICSSLHKLKDTNSNGKSESLGTIRAADKSAVDCGFFVFGDLSGKVPGIHRLYFRLWDMRINDQFPRGRAYFLKSILSDPFKSKSSLHYQFVLTVSPVVLPKEFKGLAESTFLSRAFSDQGVRLRLRKEPRSVNRSKKRSFTEFTQDGNTEDDDERSPKSARNEVRDCAPAVGGGLTINTNAHNQIYQTGSAGVSAPNSATMPHSHLSASSSMHHSHLSGASALTHSHLTGSSNMPHSHLSATAMHTNSGLGVTGDGGYVSNLGLGWDFGDNGLGLGAL
jgi:Velvet factor